MDDDFNTGGAVGVLFELVSRLNKLADGGKLETRGGRHAWPSEFAEGRGPGAGVRRHPGADVRPRAGRRSAATTIVAGLMQLLIDLRDNLRAPAKGIADKADPLKKGLFDQTDLSASGWPSSG